MPPHRECDDPHAYDTIRGMLKFEYSKGRPYRGSSACLYLNRSTQFMVLFMQRLLGTSSSSSSSSVTTTAAAIYAYDAAFGQHHSWFLQKSAHVAAYLLPNREAFIKHIRVDGSLDVAKDVATNGRKIYETTKRFYEEMNWLHLAP